MSAIEVLRAVESVGVELKVVDGVIRAAPPGRLNQDLKQSIREHKSELLRLLARRAAPTNLDALRRLCPLMWREVMTADGRRGLLWSISPHGAVVSFGPGQPLQTLDPAEVVPVVPA